jgi:hypothetical protein
MRDFAEALVAAVVIIGLTVWCAYFIVPLLRW